MRAILLAVAISVLILAAIYAHTVNGYQPIADAPELPTWPNLGQRQGPRPEFPPITPNMTFPYNPAE